MHLSYTEMSMQPRQQQSILRQIEVRHIRQARTGMVAEVTHVQSKVNKCTSSVVTACAAAHSASWPGDAPACSHVMQSPLAETSAQTQDMASMFTGRVATADCIPVLPEFT